MAPVASFFAPWADRSIEFHCDSWQFAQTGLVAAGDAGWAATGCERSAEAATSTAIAARVCIKRMGSPSCGQLDFAAPIAHGIRAPSASMDL
jgi:hypothetical protein